MRTTTIRFSFLRTNNLRMDSSYHINEAIIYRKHLTACPYPVTTIGAESEKIFFGNIFSRVYVADKEHGVPYLSASEMQKSDLNTGKYLSRKQADNLKYLMLDSGWILISCSGTLGKCVYTDKRYAEMIGTHDLIRLVPKKKNIEPGVLYAFLASKFGYAMLTHSQYGSVVQHTNPTQVRDIPIPVLPIELQKKVHTLITESARLREEADKARAKALKYFDNFAVQNQKKIFSKKVSQLKFSWAAYNNNLNVDAIKAKYSNQKVSLENFTERIFAPPLFKHIYLSSDNGYPFLTGREVTYQNQRYYRWLSPRGVRNINDYIVKKGTLVIYCSGTTDGGILGYVRIVDNNLDGACLSNHIIRLNFKNFSDACWAYGFLKSKSGESLLQALATGTMIPCFTPERLKNLEIPAPDINKDKISMLIEEYLTKKSSGNNKENEAIRLIEEDIEKWQK